MDLALNASEMPRPRPIASRAKRRDKRRTKPQLLTRDELDGRTNAAKFFDRLVIEVENDLGGAGNLSSIERSLVQAFAGACVQMHNLNARLLLGQMIDLTEHAKSVSSLVKVATRLGLQRRAKEVSTLGDFMRLAASMPAGGSHDAPAIEVADASENAPATTATSPNGDPNDA